MSGPVLTPKDEILQVLKKDDQEPLVVLDIRSPEEIAASGYFQPANKATCRWANAPGTPHENVLLSSSAVQALIPDKSTPVIVYCARGGRAAKAKEILEEQGYTNVMNAGGYPTHTQELLES